MRIAITSQGNSINSEVDPRFGRCKYFAIIDTETMVPEFIENDAINANSGAGVSSAQMMVEKKVALLLTGQVGPKARHGLDAGGVKIKEGIVGKVYDVIEKIKNGEIRGEDDSE